jgi:hypothetical protein
MRRIARTKAISSFQPQMCTPQAVNFMARYGRGLICLCMTQERATTLQLPMMTQFNGSAHQTAFTVSVEAREGVSTGISAHDRAHTIAVAIDPHQGAAGHCDAGPCVSAGGAPRRHTGAGRSYRGGRRYRAAGRALSGRGDLRDHER